MNTSHTVRVRMTENSFVEYGGQTYSGHFETRRSALGGKPCRLWIGDEFWATPEAVAAWTATKPPLVTVVGHKAAEDEI
jgi:hypothetical protein